MKSHDTDRSLHVLITGGAGYIGSVLTRRLLAEGSRVRVLDALLFDDGLAALDDPRLESIRGDIRDAELYREAVAGVDVVVHLAAVANDPSFDLDPSLGRSVNFDCLEHVMRLSAEAGVRRFVYASSASVYGVSEAPIVDESHPLVPITDYNRYKAEGERMLFPLTRPGFETIAVRAATVCGPSPRQRLDLTVNLLTAQAAVNNLITVFGGAQYRPNIHVEDLVSVYSRLVAADSLGELSGTPLNVGRENLAVSDIAAQIAERVGKVSGAAIETRATPTDDIRSYRLTSRRLRETLGFAPAKSIGLACEQVAAEILAGRLPDAVSDPRYYNVRRMKLLGGAQASL